MRIRLSTIFDAPVTDIAEYVLSRGFQVRLPGPVRYHQPCHDSLDGKGESLLEKMTHEGVESIPHCCSEAGTLALSRPDIAAAMFERKRAELSSHQYRSAGAPVFMTNCPACLNGLGRQRMGTCKHVAVAMADATSSGDWKKQVIGRLALSDIIRF